MTNDPTMM